MPHSAASDLGLHCLPMSHKKDARFIWVKCVGNRFMFYSENTFLVSLTIFCVHSAHIILPLVGLGVNS